MRYVFQLMVILGDIAIMTASSAAIYFYWKNPLVWLLVAFNFKVWHNNGAFMAWDLKNIKTFIASAKKLGL